MFCPFVHEVVYAVVPFVDLRRGLEKVKSFRKPLALSIQVALLTTIVSQSPMARAATPATGLVYYTIPTCRITVSPQFRFAASASGYALVDGTPVANSWADLTDGTLLHGINLTQVGTTVSTPVWTGTTATGAFNANGANGECSTTGSWTSSAAARSGIVGSAGVETSNWSSSGTVTCNVPAAFYCFEQ